MQKIRLSTALWAFTLTCLLILVVAERSLHENEIKLLKDDIRTLNKKLSTKSAFGSNYSDLDIYIPENATARIDDTMTYKYTQDGNSPKTSE